jgi:L-ascorbate metabolism protein UlaG (beta-lactamase superfamily)
MKFVSLIILFFTFSLESHEQTSSVTYLGNEAVMVSNGSSKIVFDPFFHNNYNIYQLVPEQILQAMFENKAPYDEIDAIFISHAHADHFAADMILKFLKSHPKSKLIAPKQAIDQLYELENSSAVNSQITAIELEYGDPPKIINIDDLLVEVVRVPHSGWPNSRLEVSNLVFRVTLENTVTVMHMGDADPNDIHFKPYENYWKSNLTNLAFPPYWFFYSSFGPEILKNRINTLESIGVHVPVEVPASLILSGEKYFSEPGQSSSIQHKH